MELRELKQDIDFTFNTCNKLGGNGLDVFSSQEEAEKLQAYIRSYIDNSTTALFLH